MIRLKLERDFNDYPYGTPPPGLMDLMARMADAITERLPDTVQEAVPEQALWAWVRTQIIQKPQYAAQMTGIEQIGYLDRLVKPPQSPTLVEVGEEYDRRTDLTDKERSRVRAAWAVFRQAVGVTTLAELTPRLAAQVGASIRQKRLSPKSVAHYYNRIKCVLKYYLTTGLAQSEVRHALDCLAVLKTPASVSLDPHPISRDDYHKLLAAADAEGRAMLLVAMNLCMYPVDLTRLRWEEIKLDEGTYSAKRGKTRVARCAVLWSRTIEALRALPRAADGYVFHRRATGLQHSDTTVRKWFWALRVAAGVGKSIQMAHIRDGAYTAAVAGEGVKHEQAQMLAGHRCGIADHYVRRNPAMTAGACAAVERAYFG